MLTKTIKVTKRVAVNVISLNTYKSPKSKTLQKLPCSACKKSIGDRPWGLAWCKEKEKKYAMRLCEDCSKKAEQALKGKVKDDSNTS